MTEIEPHRLPIPPVSAEGERSWFLPRIPATLDPLPRGKRVESLTGKGAYGSFFPIQQRKSPLTGNRFRPKPMGRRWVALP